MTVQDFAQAVYTLCLQFNGSVTSWGRTATRTVQVGGFLNDPHQHWYGIDVVWNTPIPELFELRPVAASLKLKVIRETGKPHDHLQPLTYPAGPLTAEQVDAWRQSHV